MGGNLKEAVRKVFVSLCEKGVCTLVVGSGPEKRSNAFEVIGRGKVRTQMEWWWRRP